MMKRICLFGWMALGLQAADLELAPIVYGGSGCEPETVKTVIDLEKNRIYFETLAYQTEGENSKTCLFVLPVQVAPGMKVAISRLRVRIHSQIPDNTSAIFQAELFVAGLKGPKKTYVLDGPLDDKKDLKFEPEKELLVWSGCGQSANLRLNSRLMTSVGIVQISSLKVGLKLSPC